MSDAPQPEIDDDYPLRSGPRYLAGFVVFVVINLLVFAATGKIGTALAVAFVAWLAAVLITRLVHR